MDSEFWVRESVRDRIVEDDYEVGDQLGSGISSVVQTCKHRLVNKNWAVKTIEKDKPRSRYDALSDTAVLFSVNHPNIIRLKDAYETQNRLRFVEEEALGGLLFTWITIQNVYTEKLISRNIRQILSALKYLHDHEIRHLDVRPENVLMSDPTEKAVVKLSDFALSSICPHEVHARMVEHAVAFSAP
jgi:serine/threonine protein kinase